MRLRYFAVLLAVVIGSTGQLGAAKWIGLEWSGADVSAGSTIDLEMGVAKTATVLVSGDFRNKGYTLKFQADNATGNKASVLKRGGTGSTTEEQINYTLEMDSTAIPSDWQIKKSNLNVNDNKNDLRTRYASDPPELTTPHQVHITMTMESFDPFSKIAGTYTDTLTVIGVAK